MSASNPWGEDWTQPVTVSVPAPAVTSRAAGTFRTATAAAAAGTAGTAVCGLLALLTGGALAAGMTLGVVLVLAATVCVMSTKT